jgi:hypothetical protein
MGVFIVFYCFVFAVFFHWFDFWFGSGEYILIHSIRMAMRKTRSSIKCWSRQTKMKMAGAMAWMIELHTGVHNEGFWSSFYTAFPFDDVVDCLNLLCPSSSTTVKARQEKIWGSRCIKFRTACKGFRSSR